MSNPRFNPLHTGSYNCDLVDAKELKKEWQQFTQNVKQSAINLFKPATPRPTESNTAHPPLQKNFWGPL